MSDENESQGYSPDWGCIGIVVLLGAYYFARAWVVDALGLPEWLK